MTKNSKQTYNHLNLSVLPPPISGGKENEFTYDSRLARLLRCFVRAAASVGDRLSPADVELLDDVMRFGSAQRIAEIHHRPVEAIHARLLRIFAHLDAATAHWPDSGIPMPEQQLSDLRQQVASQQAEIETLRQQNLQLQQQVEKSAALARSLTVEASRYRALAGKHKDKLIEV